MDILATSSLCPIRPWPAARCEGPLLSLGDAFVGRYHSWHGASGRRYVASVFPVDREAPDLGLPAFEACVVLAVVRAGRGRRACAIHVLERGHDRRRALAAGTEADEWHVHLLAQDRHARAEAADDLSARHCGDRPALLA